MDKFVDKDKNLVPGIVTFHSNKNRHIRCEYCRQFPHIVKQHVPQKAPAIASIEGTRYYARVLTDHLESLYHKECAKAYRISLTEEKNTAPMEIAISKANKIQIDHIGKLMIQVYLDAKRLNLSAHSWPSRYVAGEANVKYDSLNQSKSIISDGIDLQYVNQPGHLELMKAIVQSYRNDFLQKINDCVAISLRIDGSIDFTHVDKIYVMAKLMYIDGSSELVFLGIGEQTERYSTGLMGAVMEAIKATVHDIDIIFRKVSSVVTDGTAMNTGEKNGLWTLIEAKTKKVGSKIPLIKIWCAAHRSELAWKSVSNTVPEVSKVFSILSKISTYFHFSSIRTAELKKIATENNIRLMVMPKIFEIRWSQFTFALLRSVLVSWEALVIYFQHNESQADCAVYLNYLTKLENLELIAFLADLLFAFGRLQKQLQSDELTLITMKSHIDSMLRSLTSMQNTQIPGGFERNLASKLVREEDEDKVFLKSIELKFGILGCRTRRAPINVADVRSNTLVALSNFLIDRFKIDEDLLEKITPFINFDPNVDIEVIHSLIAPDISLPDLYTQFNDFANGPHTMSDMTLKQKTVHLSKTIESQNTYKELITVFCRIIACTPHSADVERMISANNLLKTKLRSRILIETENLYMFIHTNMPCLAEWNPTAAAKMFIEMKSRRNRNITPQNEITKRQSVFKGVFSEARVCKDEEDANDEATNVGHSIFDFLIYDLIRYFRY